MQLQPNCGSDKLAVLAASASASASPCVLLKISQLCLCLSDGTCCSLEDKTMADWGGLGERNMRDHSNPNIRVSKDSSSGSSHSAWSILPSSERKIRRANDITILPSSAPVDIPDWSKIYGMNDKKVTRDGSYKGDYGDDEDEDDGDDGDRIPPHEWIARKLARSQISSFSVCEGMGRTLKGRDLSKVRNSILTKTGFIE